MSESYGALKLATKYLRHRLSASNAKGHGVHSPFTFDLIKFVLNDKKQYPSYSLIEKERTRLLKDDSLLDVDDMGAGSNVVNSTRRKVSDIARSSLKPPKWAQLLHRVCEHYRCKRVLELGTSLGITTAYFSKAPQSVDVLTIEGSAAIAERATETLGHIEADNVRQLIGNFDTVIPEIARTEQPFDLVFIDGNHRYEPTMRYFNELFALGHPDTLFIFDDVHWSAGMEAAWDEIKADGRVTLSLDLFFIGIVSASPGFKVKQHFNLRY